MAGVTQTIPQYSLGISEQPDNLKFPGQVSDSINAIPDVTKGLFKRPGAKRIGTDALSSVQSGGSWFHYFRDESEGSYIGQIAADGQVRVWRCNDGQLMTTAYGTGGQTAIQNYLQTATPENLQFLTINDTTFVTNRDSSNYTQAEIDGGGTPSGISAGNARTVTTIGTTGTTDARPHTHFGFIELLRTENGRQYGIDLNNSAHVTTLTRATRVSIASDTLDESDGTGHCPGIGTQVFSVTAASSYTDPTIVSVNKPRLSFTLSSNDTITNTALDIITYGSLIGTGLPAGTAVTYTTAAIPGQDTGGHSGIQNLPPDATYYIVPYDIGDGSANATTTYFRLASTAAAAAAGNYIQIMGNGTNNTHTFTEVVGQPYTSGKDNLIFRINTLGQQGVSPNYSAQNAGPGGSNYRCSYNREVVLLHGGEGWTTGDEVTVTLDSASTNYNYSIRIDEIESTQLNATITAAGNDSGLIRPTPTPFDADTAVTTDTIIGGIIDALPKDSNGNQVISAEHIGSGIYLHSANPFTINVVEDDLMRCFQSSLNDVQNLPNQCKHGYIVKISNSRMSQEDDYYLRFDGENNKSGAGSWSECALPGIAKTLTNMPLVIQRTAFNANTQIATFTVKQFTYANREVGDDFTNPIPSFEGQRINKVLFFRNRLALLSGENVILSRPGTLGEPDFFIETALTVSAADPIDISAASMFPSELFDGIEVTTGLLVFSTNQQFLLSSDDTVLNPDTAKLRSVSTFNYNKDIPPLSLGTTVAYIDNSGKFSRLNEMANVRREGEPSVVEVSKIVPTLLEKNIDLITNSRENGIVLMGRTNSNIVTGFKYFQVAEQRQQASWFKWKFNKGLIYHFIIDDEYFFLDQDYFLQSLKLVQADDDPSTTDENAINYLLHLDNHTTIKDGVFSGTNNTTTFSNVVWLDDVANTSSNPIIYNLAIIDSEGRYAQPTISGTTLTLTGDWSNTSLPSGQTHFTVGYVYDYEVKFPTLYPVSTGGGKATADVNSSLVLHRLKFHFGKVGSYKTILTRVGKPVFTQQHESALLSQYDAGDVPYLPEFIKTVPVYERNTNVEVTLKSTHPSPATLHSVSWEGDYSPKFYKRV